ncbi:MAG: transcription termination factor NusA, partial [Anaerolineae bacterium]|nr:transcription termination factor NusA [Anaerolineae bacterium]
EQVRTEHYRLGQRLKVYLMEVRRTGRGPQVLVSRTHRNLLRRLLELEVPEIHSGVVELKAIAREAGHRSKIAVAARQQGVDPIGSCVGLRGIRIQNIVNELNGERIDIVEWHPDTATFIANALSPAPVDSVAVNSEEKVATVVVPDRQLSLAIGREGQNARLAAKLTGWRIDIIGATEAAETAVRRAEEEATRAAARAQVSENMPLEQLGVSKRILHSLAKVGITELEPLLDRMEEGDRALLDIKGLGSKSLQELKDVLEDRDVYAILGREKAHEEEAPAEPEPEKEPAVPVEEAAVAAGEAEEEEEAPVAEAEAISTEAEEEAEALAEDLAAPPAELVDETTPLPASPEVPGEVTPEAAERVQPAPPQAVPHEKEVLQFGEDRPDKKKRRRRKLVYDETLGEVVAKTVRKPGRRVEDW